MFFASSVFYFVVLASAVTLHATGKTDIRTATDAAEALRPLSHGAATLLFALGLIGSGFLAVPVLTGSSAYALCEAFRWRYGLNEKFRVAPRFYLIIAAATLVGLLINFLKIPPVTALFWTAVINGVLAPPLIVLIMVVSNNKKIMGERTNGPLTNFLGWSTAVIMSAAAIGMFLTWKS
jgi:Mn2+/Fe2+ NRAMP family transporter